VFAEKLKHFKPTKFVQNHMSFESEARLSQKMVFISADALVRAV